MNPGTKYLITGAGGMLGADLVAALADRDVTGLARSELDIADPGAVADAVQGYDVIVNAAAHTKVDDAETQEDIARLANAVGPANLAAAVAATGARLVQVSTDYVFDGSATAPYGEDEPVHPASAYGRTKAEGERAVLATLPDRGYVVRGAWLYGAHGPNFAKTMLRLAAERDEVMVVDDQVGQPTWTADLAQRIVLMLDARVPAGVYHGTNSGQTTWFGFARAVLEEAGLDPERIQPTTTDRFPRPAPRPAYSVLGHDRWTAVGLPPMRHWRDALAAAAAAGVLSA